VRATLKTLDFLEARSRDDRECATIATMSRRLKAATPSRQPDMLIGRSTKSVALSSTDFQIRA
jgi:hypothetical protein